MKRNNLCTLLLVGIIAFHAHANTLVTTRGPVCSGMGSYLANAIKTLDNSYYIISQNDIFNTLYYQMINVVFPHHMAIINSAIDQANITPAITNYHIYFKEATNPEQKLQATEAIQYIRDVLNDPTSENFLNALYLLKNHAEMAELAYHAACDHNVVWERRTKTDWDYEIGEIEELFGNVLNTVTYCPPTKMIEQWQQRNAHAINEKKAFDRRLIKQVLMTFFTNFQQIQDEYQDDAIVLSRNEFDSIIDQAADYILTVPQNEFGMNGEFTSSEFTLEELFQFKARIYAEFDFDNVDYVVLAPVLTYDVLLSSKEACVNLAQELING